MLFYPDYRFRRVWQITPAWLKKKGISVLLLDVDNTLTTHDSPVVPPQVWEWLEQMKENKIPLAILSNNSDERVKPFAERLGVPFFARAMKPLGQVAHAAVSALGAKENQTALVGDQIFTDILCARTAGLIPILVEPMEPEVSAFFRCKRVLERVVLRGCTVPYES